MYLLYIPTVHTSIHSYLPTSTYRRSVRRGATFTGGTGQESTVTGQYRNRTVPEQHSTGTVQHRSSSAPEQFSTGRAELQDSTGAPVQRWGASGGAAATRPSARFGFRVDGWLARGKQNTCMSPEIGGRRSSGRLSSQKSTQDQSGCRPAD